MIDKLKTKIPEDTFLQLQEVVDFLPQNGIKIKDVSLGSYDRVVVSFYFNQLFFAVEILRGGIFSVFGGDKFLILFMGHMEDFFIYIEEDLPKIKNKQDIIRKNKLGLCRISDFRTKGKLKRYLKNQANKIYKKGDPIREGCDFFELLSEIIKYDKNYKSLTKDGVDFFFVSTGVKNNKFNLKTKKGQTKGISYSSCIARIPNESFKDFEEDEEIGRFL